MSFFRRPTRNTTSSPRIVAPELPRVLFVDDEEGNLFVAREMLADAPVVVLTATDGASALETLRSEPIAVLVSDQRMPGMSGVELLQRAATDWPDTIRLLLTGFADLGAVVDAINRGGIWRYLTKPIDPTDLQHAIRLATEQYRTRAAHREEVRSLKARIDELEQRLAAKG